MQGRSTKKTWLSYFGFDHESKPDLLSALPPEVIGLIINQQDDIKDVARLATVSKTMNAVVKNTQPADPKKSYTLIFNELRKNYIVDRLRLINEDIAWAERGLEEKREHHNGNEMCHPCACGSTSGCAICFAGVGGGLGYALGGGALGGGLAFMAGAGVAASLPIGFFFACCLIGWGYSVCDDQEAEILQKNLDQLLDQQQDYYRQLDALNVLQEQEQAEDEGQEKVSRMCFS